MGQDRKKLMRERGELAKKLGETSEELEKLKKELAASQAAQSKLQSRENVDAGAANAPLSRAHFFSRSLPRGCLGSGGAAGVSEEVSKPEGVSLSESSILIWKDLFNSLGKE
eukprot:1316772-Rhodomonas_salina.1